MKTTIITLIILLLLLSGCTLPMEPAPGGDVVAPTNIATADPQREVTPDAASGDAGVPASDQPPLATLTVDGKTQTAGLGTYCWSNDETGTGICLDAIGIPTPKEPLVVSSPFTAQFDIPVEETPRDVVVTIAPASPEAEMQEDARDLRWWQYQEGQNFTLPLERQPELELDLEPGQYVIDLFVSWEGLGDASYGFLVEVKE